MTEPLEHDVLRGARPPIPGAVFVLLWPSCFLALIALAPRAVAEPSLATALPFAFIVAVACAPIALAIRTMRRAG